MCQDGNDNEDVERTCGQMPTGQVYVYKSLKGVAKVGRTYLMALLPAVWGSLRNNSSGLRDLTPYSADGSVGCWEFF